jgi:hypothetical protein
VIDWITLPWITTAPVTPVVEYFSTVVVPVDHVTTAVPLVVLVPQLPLAVASGSPPTPTAILPELGAPDTLELQLVRSPVNE